MTLLPEIRTQLLHAGGHARRRRATAGTLAIAAATLMSIAVAIVFVVLVHHARSHRSAARGAVPGRQALIDELAPLRRPQTAVDRAFARRLERHGGTFGPFGAIDVSLVRYIGTTPWGERLFLVPTLPPTHRQFLRFFAGPDGKIPSRVHISFAAFNEERVGVFSRSGGGGGTTAASLLRYGINSSEGAGRSFAGGATETRQLLVVPDGVAKVTLLLARQPFPGQYGAPVYHHVFRVTLPVRNNLVAVQVDREAIGPAEIWYAADGRVLRRIGHFAPLGRVRRVPLPGPETALSRAAELNPSTPNLVWVTPATGTPHTLFTIHFRVLLNGADYRYKFTGTSCPGFTFPGGTGKPDAVRGEVWSDSVGAVEGQALCPGSYHVAVSVLDRGRFGTYRGLPGPFGTAKFTVG